LLLVTLKRPQPVVVVRLSLFNSKLAWRLLLLGVFLMPSTTVFSEPPSLLAQIHAHTPAELSSVLARAEQWSEMHDAYIDQPIVVILHGSEAKAFLRQNYGQYRSLVDQAAKLDAFNVIDIQICETWMGSNEVVRDQLPPFIETVTYGPSRIKELINAGYQSF
jgi:intracellular sulfur oxidation DsrE/DsrF family protein